MVLQFVTQALRGVEELKQKILHSSDILTDNEALIARLQLQKIYQQILILDLEYAINKKLEQELWNLGFKNYIDVLQKLAKDKKNPKRSEHQGLLNICLESASGFYLVLLEEICVTFSVSLPFPSYRKYSYLQSNAKKSNLEHLIKQPQKSSCYYICQHCLVHLGDIARYKLRCKQAEIFYRNAIILSPFSGQPYNQLALLETSRGDKLGTVFYYIRSISVRNPFPAATSNLALTLNKANNANGDWNSENKTVLSTNEFITLFLKVHALLHLTTDILPCATYVRLLSTSLTAHVATESFTSVNLLQMMVINMYAYHNINAEGGGNVVDDSKLTADEKLAKTLLVELIAGSLNAFLLPIYTYKQEDSLLQYFALPAIKITLDWIRTYSYVLEESGFVNRPQIWPAFCKLTNELEPFLKSFSHEKYKNITLPEDQDLQGFIPLQNAIPEFRYIDNEIDLDSLCKLRAYRIKSFAKWLANEGRFSLIRMSKEESSTSFEATISGSQSSNELIIQQLEELLKNDCNITHNSSTSNDGTVLMEEVNKLANQNTSSLSDTASVGILANNITEENGSKNKRAGILKTHSFLDKKKNDMINDNKKHSRQNVALQTILKRNQEQEHKQVTFKTPSPSLSNCSDNQETSTSTNHSQLWPSNISVSSHLPVSSHSMFVSSFSGFPDAFRTLPPHSSTSLPPPPQVPPPPPPVSSAMNYNKNSQFYPQQNLSSQEVQQRNFSAAAAAAAVAAAAATPLYQKSFATISNERAMDPFSASAAVTDNRNQNIMENSLMSQIAAERHLTQRNHQFSNQTNLNFLPPWKQESNPWWIEDKQKLAAATNSTAPSVMDESSNSFFHYRNTVMPQSSPSSGSTPFGNGSHVPYQPQQIQAAHALRQIPPQSQPQPQPQQLPVPQPQQQQMSHLRPQNTSNVSSMPIGLWPNSFKPPQQAPPPQNSLNSLYNSNLLNKPFFDPLPSYSQNTLPNPEDKSSFAQHTQLPNNTYSLFNPMWSNTQSRNEDTLNQPANNPLAILTQQSIWSEGISPLQRLLEQQKQMRDGYQNSQQSSDG